MVNFQTAWQRFWREMRRDERVVLLSCLIVLLGCAGVNYSRWHNTSPLPPVFVDAPDKVGAKGQASNSDAHAQHIVAHITGAVRHPGVYALASDARVADALQSAGGASPEGDSNALNLAAPVQDGQQIIVPTHSAKVIASAPAVPTALSKAGVGTPPVVALAKSKKAPAAPVNVNQADAAELQTLPGVGPSLAQSIIAYRQQHGGLKSLNDLDAVKGIGPKKLEKMSQYVRF